MNIFELFGNVSLKGMGKVDGQLSQLEKRTQKAQKGLKVMGAAFTALGAAGLAVVASTKKINAQLAVTAINLGLTTKEMRALTLATTNVTFPIKEVVATFDLLARAGVKDQEVLKAVATSFDTLGDAIGIPASVVTAQLIPAMKTFNIDATTMAGKTDKLTWLFRNTTVNLEDFNKMVGYTTPELVEMGLTVDDMIAILAEMEDQGYSGITMTREFQKAVNLASKEQIPLNEALGISAETIGAYKVELEGATGLTQEYADAANEQYGITDKLKQKWGELTLGASGFLEPLEPLLAGMTALGPVMLIASTNTKAMAVAVKLLRFATKKALGVFGVILMVLGLVAAVVMRNEELMDSLREAFSNIMTALAPVIKIFSELISQVMNTLKPALEKLLEAFSTIAATVLSKVIPIFATLVETIMSVLIPVLETLFGVWETVSGFLVSAWSTIKIAFLKGVKAILDTMSTFLGWLPFVGGKIKAARDKIAELIDAENIKDDAEAASGAVDDMAAAIEDRAAEMTDAIREEFEAQAQAQLDAIEDMRTAAQDAHDEAVEALRREYGDIERLAEEHEDTKVELARKATDLIRESLRRELGDAKRVFREKMDMLDDEYNAKLRLLDDETLARVRELERQIDEIDKTTKKEEELVRKAKKQERLLELQAAVDNAKTNEEYRRATEELVEFIAEIERERILDGRELEKDALRDRIDAIKAAAEKEATRLEEELAAKKEHEDELLDSTTGRINSEIDALDAALEEQIRLLAIELVEKIEIEDKKLEATQIRLDATLVAQKAHNAKILDEEYILLEALKRARDEYAEEYQEPTPEPTPTPAPTPPYTPYTPYMGGTITGTVPEYIPPPITTIPGFHEGGLIPEPTLLYGLKSMRPYATAGERGPERVVSGAEGFTIIVEEMNVRGEDDIPRIARELQRLLQEEVRSRGG